MFVLLHEGVFVLTSTRVLVALDIDGVLNRLPRIAAEPSHDEGACTIGGYLIRWYPEIICRLRAILLRSDVEVAWLTTWLPHLPRIRELEQALGLSGSRESEPLVKHLALHPVADWRSEIFPEDVSLTPAPLWWKYYAAAELRARIQPERFAWIDDDLGRKKDLAGIWQPQESEELLLIRTDSDSGLASHNLDQLEQWIDRD